jgi:hypothetical protein
MVLSSHCSYGCTNILTAAHNVRKCVGIAERTVLTNSSLPG